MLTTADVDAFAQVWYRGKREHSGAEHKKMNAILDAVVARFLDPAFRAEVQQHLAREIFRRVREG